MAMTCIKGSGECNGCMRCQDPRPQDIAGTCPVCDEPVLTGEDRYIFPDGEIVHDDCAMEFIREHFFQAG